MKLALATLDGTKSVAAVCEELGISEAAVHKFRSRWLQEALVCMEPRRLGRPPKAKEAADREEVQKLREEIAALRKAAQIAAAREEIAVAMPGVLHRGRKGKKTR
jgi:transposase